MRAGPATYAAYVGQCRISASASGFRRSAMWCARRVTVGRVLALEIGAQLGQRREVGFARSALLHAVRDRVEPAGELVTLGR